LETINLIKWTDEDLTCNQQEDTILRQWNFTPRPSANEVLPRPAAPASSTHWMRPPVGFFKVNFDGASKGNPGSVGFGVVIRDDTGQIIYVSVGSLGVDTNNAAKLWALIKGIQATMSLGIQKLVVEGDSQIIIKLFTRLLHGFVPSKIFS
jgi:hypothetical protein